MIDRLTQWHRPLIQVDHGGQPSNRTQDFELPVSTMLPMVSAKDMEAGSTERDTTYNGSNAGSGPGGPNNLKLKNYSFSSPFESNSKVLNVELGSDSCPAECDGVLSGEFEFGVDYGERHSTVFGTCMNTVSTVVGAGVLSLPVSISLTGWGLGLVLFAFGALSTQFGLYLLFEVMSKLGGDQLSFGRVSELVNRTWFPLLSSILVLVIQIAVMILFLNVTADNLVPVAEYFYTGGNGVPTQEESDSKWVLSRTFWLTLPFLVLSVPLSLMKKVTFLQYTSTIALGSILFVAALVTVYATKPVEYVCETFLLKNNATQCVGDLCCISESNESVQARKCCIGPVMVIGDSFTNFITTFPVIITAFCCAPQVFMMWNDLISPNTKRMNTATSSAMLITVSLYSMVSLSGYFTYGSNVDPNLLGSYPLTLEVTVARLGISLHTALCYPLIFFAGRDSLVHIISHTWYLYSKRDIGSDPTARSYQMLWWAVVLFQLSLTFLMAILNIPYLVLLNLGGSISVSNLSFTIPGVLYLCLMPNVSLAKKVGCIFLIFLGLFVCITNIVLWAI